MSLESLLDQLEQNRLIHQMPEMDASPLGGAYEFEHALAQDSAYQSLLRARRRAIHRRVAECFERLYPDRQDEYAGLLARHYAEAGDDLRALSYAERAGDAALRTYALAEAATLYGQGLELAARVGDVDSLGRLSIHQGRAQELLGRHDLALRIYEQMQEAGRQAGNRQVELEALLRQTLLRSTANALFDPAQAEQLAARSVALAREVGDDIAEVRILWSQVNLYRFTHRNQQALPLGEKALAIIRRRLEVGAPDREVQELYAFLLNDMCHVYTWTGHPHLAGPALRESGALWRRLDNRAMLTDHLATAGLYLSLFGDVEAARTAAAEGVRIADAIHNPWGQSYSRSAASILHWHAGEMSRALATMVESVRFGQEGGYLVAQALMRAYLALLHMDVGAAPQGLDVARAGLAAAEQHLPALVPALRAVMGYLLLANDDRDGARAAVEGLEADESDNPFVLDLVWGGRAAVLLALGRVEEALAVGGRHVAYLEQHGFRLLLPMASHAYGRALLAAGQAETARIVLAEALRQAEALEVRREGWRLLATMAEMEEAAGNHTEAEALRRRCREEVAFIAGQIEEPHLREAFLALPEIPDH
ncbi:MAG: hypothetical protein K1X65_00825 [Caldilineales bacterium]|nr:hypothetical protein [Caldilineales bacterium]MCW5859490.1 hypothetical protein [Caldilineales bacterium]